MATIQLQGIGKRKAIAAGELTAGMVTIWNYGYECEVLSVEFSKTGKTLVAKLRNLHDGKVYGRKMTASRLVAIA